MQQTQGENENTGVLQMSRKCILGLRGTLLVAIDQHAADERIRLEALQSLLLVEKASAAACAAACVAGCAPRTTQTHHLPLNTTNNTQAYHLPLNTTNKARGEVACAPAAALQGPALHGSMLQDNAASLPIAGGAGGDATRQPSAAPAAALQDPALHGSMLQVNAASLPIAGGAGGDATGKPSAPAESQGKPLGSSLPVTGSRVPDLSGSRQGSPARQALRQQTMRHDATRLPVVAISQATVRTCERYGRARAAVRSKAVAEGLDAGGERTSLHLQMGALSVPYQEVLSALEHVTLTRQMVRLARHHCSSSWI